MRNEGHTAVNKTAYFLQIGLRSELLDELADGGGACEGNFVNFHVLCNCSAGGWSVAAQDVDDARGETSLLDQLGDVKSRQGSLLAGLEDHDASSGKARSHLPSEHQQGEVPWDDLAANADGFVVSHGQEIAVDGDGFALDLIGPA